MLKMVGIAFGCNVGNCRGNIEKGLDLIREKVEIVKISSLYQTSPWGNLSQPPFLNGMLLGKTDLSPQALLIFCKEIEKRVGRIPRERWGPRELDLDIIFYENEIIEEENLIIPHRFMFERLFVLVPFSEIFPQWRHPRYKLSIKEKLKILQETEKEKEILRKIPFNLDLIRKEK